MTGRVALAVSGDGPCARAGKITLALAARGWVHDALCDKRPSWFPEAYRVIDYDAARTMDSFGEAIGEHEAVVLHVHNEPNWPVGQAKRAAAGRPVIMDVHDVSCARSELMDVFEEEAFASADAFVFVSEEQRAFAAGAGLEVEGRPYVVLPNLVSERLFVREAVLPKVGGVVYEGGADPRSGGRTWRDLSEIADTLDGELHMFALGGDVDYGIAHACERDYGVLVQRLARHDWGLVGTPSAGFAAHEHSLPNKVYDYFAAGLPLLAVNAPLVRPLCDAGLGVYCEDAGEVADAAATDSAPFRERVLAERAAHTMESAIGPLAELYDALTSAA